MIYRYVARAARLTLLTVGGIALASCQGRQQTSDRRPGLADKSGSQDMHGMPGMTGMAPSGSSALRLTPDQMRQFGVTFGTVATRPLTTRVRTVGTVVADEQRLSQMTPKVGGFVERLYVDQTGQLVRRGDPLVDLYSPDLVAAQEELLVAVRLAHSTDSASSLVDAGRRRLRAWDVSEAQIDRLLRSGTVERTVTLYAATTGIVLEKKVVQGQSIQPGEMLLSVADLSTVWVDADVREMDAASVRVGSPAAVEFTSYPGRTFDGRVGFIYPTVQGDARSVTARIVVPNREGRLKPGMYATVTLDAPPRTALSVPSSAILNTGRHTLVFVDLGGGSLAPQEITIGLVAGDYTEVMSGVQPGQRVVTSAQYLLDSESNLAETMKSMIGQTGATDMSGMDMPVRPKTGGHP